MAETDKITIEAINQDTDYVDSKLAHKLRLEEQKILKPKPKTLVELVEQRMTPQQIADQKRREARIHPWNH